MTDPDLDLVPDTEAATRKLRESHELHQAGDYEAALLRARESVSLNPVNARAQAHLGNLLEREPALPEAIACFRQAIALEPTFASHHHRLAQLLARDGHHEAALDSAREAFRLDAGQARFARTLGERCKHLHLAPEAQSAWRAATQLEPDRAESWVALSHVSAQLGDHAEAITAAQRALSLNPSLLGVRAHLGNVFVLARQWPEAEAEYATVLEVDPNHAGSLLSYIRLLTNSDRGTAALPLLERLLAADPSNAEAKKLLIGLKPVVPADIVVPAATKPGKKQKGFWSNWFGR